MDTKKYIIVQQYCENANIEEKFLENLNEYGLIAIEYQQSERVIFKKNISAIEKMFRLHTDLGLNFEGIDVVNQLLKKISKMENEMLKLQNEIDFYK